MADAAYGLSPLVILNTALFVLFAVSFYHPTTQRDWRVMGGFSAFMVALFTEMYGMRDGLPARQLAGIAIPTAGGHARGRTLVERPDRVDR